MKKLFLTLVACVCAFAVMAGEGQCKKSKSECPAKKASGDTGKDSKGGCPKEKKDGQGQKA